tara:strand:- start:165 stop:980 length:816 start_codon:yes stop_codon:yes gene_type:complete
MKINFWGVRGSLPTPGANYNKYGGNTSCVELQVNGKTIIFDMGSGIKYLGNYLTKNSIKNFTILISHFHYDHTCGLPFFGPAYDPNTKFTVYSGILPTRHNTLNVLDSQISSPSFPITINDFNAKIKYKDFKVGKEFLLDKDVSINTICLNHPDGAVGYRVEHKGKSVCYITDHEHQVGVENQKLINFVKNSDALIYDSTYDDKHFTKYIGWGHSTWQEGGRLAEKASVKKFFIFHHNPDNDDKKMSEIEVLSSQTNKNFFVAKEGMCVKI